MVVPCPNLSNGKPLVVGSAGAVSDLLSAAPEGLGESCDILEVRLDLLEDLEDRHSATRPWRHLSSLPLLFTARRPEEGGAGELGASRRSELLMSALDEASLIDIEVASIDEFSTLLEEIKKRRLPWIASFHDFDKLPDGMTLADACERARLAGAHAFKLAAHLVNEAELERLVEFQLADHDIPTATMGMGVLGAQSRVQCAKAGSVLNYGFLGTKPTAPGQMSAGELKAAIRK